MISCYRVSLWASLFVFAGFACPHGMVPKASARMLPQLPRPVPENRINVATEPGANFGEKLRGCIRRLVPNGGTCDAISIAGAQTVTDDPFAGAVGPLRVLLGNVTIDSQEAWKLPDNIELAGKGSGTVLRLAPGANKDLIRNAGGIRGNRRISIHDLTLDGNGANQTGPVSTIHLNNVSDFTIERVTLLNSAAHGIALDDGCIRGRLLRNRIEGVKSGSGIRAGNTPPTGSVAFLEIRDNEVSKVAEGDGILVLGAEPGGEHTLNVNIAGNTITGVKGASIEVGDGSRSVTVTGNRIELRGAPGGSSGSTGIAVRSAQNVRVSGNKVAGDATEHEQVGLLAWSPGTDQGGTLSELTMENNTVSDIAGYGIRVDSGKAIHLVKNKVIHSVKNNIYVTTKATEVTQQGNVLE
jgi:hypothetical protein